MGTTADEWASAGELTGEGLTVLTGMLADTHDAVLQRLERVLPPRGAAIAARHRRTAGRIYGLVRRSHTAVPAVTGVAAAVMGGDAPPVASSKVGTAVLPIVNGLWGDQLAARSEPLAIQMAVRRRNADVVTDAAGLAAAFPDARADLVVFLHGLFETERCWARGEAGGYPVHLQRDLDVTSLCIRYNTGLRISDNGRELSQLLAQVVAAWPVPVRAIALVGHSMGGLVARSACHTGRIEDAQWVPKVRHLVSLGTPHLGSPVEKGVHLADWALRKLPETAPLGSVVSQRSVGIKDLRFGAVSEQDWSGHDPDEFLRDRCTDVPLLDHATHYWVSASVIGGEQHVLGRLVGDGLVRAPSASGKGRSRSVPLAAEHGVHVESTSHLRLLNHPAVYDQLRHWLSGIDEGG